MATFRRIAVPQDQQFVLPNGTINPAWYRYLLELQAMQPELIGLNNDTSSVTARVATLEGNLLKPNSADVDTSTLPFGASYVEAEAEALEARVRDYGTKINTILARLRAAKILGA